MCMTGEWEEQGRSGDGEELQLQAFEVTNLRRHVYPGRLAFDDACGHTLELDPCQL